MDGIYENAAAIHRQVVDEHLSAGASRFTDVNMAVTGEILNIDNRVVPGSKFSSWISSLTASSEIECADRGFLAIAGNRQLLSAEIDIHLVGYGTEGYDWRDLNLLL